MNPGSGFRGGSAGLSVLATVLAAVLLCACGPERSRQTPPGGLIVEDVEAGYGAARAGLLPGDVLIAWDRGEGDSASASRALRTPVDRDLAELEGGQTATVTLEVRRQGETLAVTLPPAPWKIRVRPPLAPDEEARLEQGRRLIVEGRAEETPALWHGLAESAAPRVGAWLALACARALIDAGETEPAEAWIEEAVRVAETAGDPELQGWTWLQIGDLRQDARDYPSAIDAYTRGIEVSEGRWMLSARLRRGLGDTRFRNSDHSAAAVEYRHLQQEWRLHGALGSEYIAATIGLGKVERNQSRFEGAADYFADAVEVARRLSPNHPHTAFALQEAGTLAYWQSDLPLAEERYREAATIYGALGIADRSLAYLHMGLGGVFLERGELVAAESSYSQAREIFEHESPQSLLVAWSLRGLGGVAQVRNNLPLARRRYGEALRILGPRTVHRMDRAMVLDELGTVAHEQGDLETAESAIAESLVIMEKDYPHSMFPPRHRTDLAAVLLDSGQLKPAGHHLEKALAEWQRLLPGSLDQADTHSQIGELAYRSGDLGVARSHHRAALAIRSRLAPDSSVEAASHHALGRVALAAGAQEEALDHLLRALQAIEAQLGNLGVSEVSRARFRQRQADTYKATVALLLDLGDPEAAFDVLERYRAQLGRGLVDVRRLNLQRTGRPDLVQRRQHLVAEYEATWRRLSAAHPGPAGRAEVERLRGRLAELEQERQIVREQIRRADPEHSAADPSPATWADLRRNLDPATGILSYNVTPDATWLFALRGDQLKVVRLEVGGDRLKDLVRRFRLLLAAEGPGGAGRGALERQAQELYRLLVAPAQSSIEPAEELIILPDGPLHRLPFAALVRDGSSHEYLVELKPLAIRSSLAGWRPPAASAGRAESKERRALLAFGDVSMPPAPDAPAPAAAPPGPGLEGGWPGLPFARAEVRSLRRLFGSGAEVRVAAAATEEAAKHRSPGFRYLHFATHARLDSALPFDSFLVLSPSRSAEQGHEDGLLRAWEVAEEMRLNASVVTLSACESGLGEELAGAGLLGLTKAFHLAGADSVAASLWRVNDRSTSALMVRFYGGLRSGLSPRAALRQAQMDFLHGPVELPPVDGTPLDRLRIRVSDLLRGAAGDRSFDYSHPHHWAAFQLYEAAR